MKKYNVHIFIITLIILISSVNLGYANSGPINWRGNPSLEILSVDENSPIVIENEDLIFDFSKDEYLEHSGYSISALVTAAYRMANNTLENQAVQMAFPIISSIEDFNPANVDIKIDGKSIPFDVYIGDEIRVLKGREDKEEENGLDFGEIIKSINKEVYSPQHYDLKEMGILYTYDVKKTSEADVYFVIDYTYDSNKTRIMDKGFNMYNVNDGETRCSSLINDNEILEIYVMGGDIDFEISGFTDGQFSNKTDDYTCEIKREIISVEDYLEGAVQEYKDSARYSDYLTDNQLYSLIYRELDDAIGHNVVSMPIDGFYYSDRIDRIILLVYEVNFPKESKRDVSVSYISRGAMSRRETYEPLYRFQYLLNPAKRWADFKNFNIEIRPPKSNPYVVDSSISLGRDGDGNYAVGLEFLPDEDLSFTLYYKEKVTFYDKLMRKAADYSFMIPVMAVITSSLIMYIVRKFRRKAEY